MEDIRKMDIKEYKYRTELHTHTAPASACSDYDPVELVQCYAGLGYDSLVICNHFYDGMRYYGAKEKCISTYLQDYDRAAEAGASLGIHVILGCEIRFSENINDYLLFGIDRSFLWDAYEYLRKGLAEFSENFRGENRVLLQAHPFRTGMTHVDPKYLDGIETFNVHLDHNSRVAQAARYAREHDMIVSAGSDCHHRGQEGFGSIRTKQPLCTSEDIAAVMRSRDYLLEVGGCLILPYATS